MLAQSYTPNLYTLPLYHNFFIIPFTIVIRNRLNTHPFRARAYTRLLNESMEKQRLSPEKRRCRDQIDLKQTHAPCNITIHSANAGILFSPDSFPTQGSPHCEATVERLIAGEWTKCWHDDSVNNPNGSY